MKGVYIERRAANRRKGSVELLLISAALLIASGISTAVAVDNQLCTVTVSLATVVLLGLCLVMVRYSTAVFEYEAGLDALIVRRIGKRDAELFRAEYKDIEAFFPMRDSAAKRYPHKSTVDACAALYGRLGRAVALYSRDGKRRRVRLLFEPTAAFCSVLANNIQERM